MEFVVIALAVLWALVLLPSFLGNRRERFDDASTPLGRQSRATTKRNGRVKRFFAYLERLGESDSRRSGGSSGGFGGFGGGGGCGGGGGGCGGGGGGGGC